MNSSAVPPAAGSEPQTSSHRQSEIEDTRQAADTTAATVRQFCVAPGSPAGGHPARGGRRRPPAAGDSGSRPPRSRRTRIDRRDRDCSPMGMPPQVMGRTTRQGHLGRTGPANHRMTGTTRAPQTTGVSPQWSAASAAARVCAWSRAVQPVCPAGRFCNSMHRSKPERGTRTSQASTANRPLPSSCRSQWAPVFLPTAPSINAGPAPGP